MLWAYSLLGAGVLGNSLGSLRDSVLGKLSWKEKPDSSLDLPGGDGGPLVVMGEPAGLSGNALEQVVDKGVHDAHGLGRNTSVRVNLLEDLVDVDSIGFLPPLVLLLLVSLGDSLGGFASGFGSFSRSLRGHVDGIVAQVNCLPGPGEPLFLSTFGTTASGGSSHTAVGRSARTEPVCGDKTEATVEVEPVLFETTKQQASSCLDVAKEARSRERQSPDPAVLDSSSPLGVSTVFSARVTMLPVLELVLQSTWLPSWSTWLLRSSSWPAMLPVTTRRPESSPATSSWPSGMMKS